VPDDTTKGIRSTASIRGHPIHPMLIPFPIAFLIGALGTDLVYAATGNELWGQFSMWLIGAGFVTGAMAASVGLIDFVTLARARGPTGWIHFGGNACALICALVNVIIRIRDPLGAVLPTGLILSLLTSGILLVTGWMGGELAYRLKIGMTD
jgi:uncharacterized membrane protein